MHFGTFRCHNSGHVRQASLFTILEQTSYYIFILNNRVALESQEVKECWTHAQAVGCNKASVVAKRLGQQRFLVIN